MGKKGISKHRKRLNAPITYPIPRKHGKFAPRAIPSSHPLDITIPLSIIVRDVLGYAETMREVRKIISSGNILVDRKIRRNSKFSVGPMDTLSIPKTGANLRVTPYPGKRKLWLHPISEEDTRWKLCKVTGKRLVRGKRIQLGLHDGKNIFLGSDTEDNDEAEVEADPFEVKTGSTLKISLPDQEIIEHFPLEDGMQALISGGANIGKVGTLIEQEKRIGKHTSLAVLGTQEGEVRTALEYIFIIGKDSPLIEIPQPSIGD